MTSSKKRRPRAGAAYVAAIENDPAARAALERAQARLRAFAETLKEPEVQRELERSRREQEQAFQALADAIRESVRAAQSDLADLGFMPPKTLEDWEHLARVVEMPFETIKAGNFTAGDVYVMALAWMDRQRMKMRISTNDTAASGGTPASNTWQPPAGFVGVKAIGLDPRFSKNGKNPPRTTIQNWQETDTRNGKPPEVITAPDNGEVHLPEVWVMDHIARWTPRP